jgi:hypothetical protein
MKYVDAQQDDGLVKLSEYLPQAKLSKDAIATVGEMDFNEDYGILIKEAFADQENRMFPIHTPSATIISAIYAQNQDVPDIIKKACQTALEEWGIEEQIFTLEKEADDHTPPMDEVMLLPSLGKLPVLDVAMLLKSASTLSSHWGQLTIAQKVESSVQLGKFARIYDVDMSSFDSKFNRYGLEADCDLGKLSQEVSIRTASVKNKEFKDKYQAFLSKLASHKRDQESMVCTDKDINTSIAYELLELDKQAGLYGAFDAIHDTYNVVSYKKEGGLLKTAKEEENKTEDIQIGGYNIPLMKIATIFEDDAKQIFSELGGNIVQDGGVNIDMLEERLALIPISAQNEIAQRINQQ